MAITGITTRPSGVTAYEGLSASPPAEADMAWFTAQMQHVATRPSPRDAGPSVIAQASGEIQKNADRAARDLQRASRSIDPQQTLQANRSLSSFYLESLLSAKLVSKAAQSVEKLTSLQ